MGLGEEKTWMDRIVAQTEPMKEENGLMGNVAC